MKQLAELTPWIYAFLCALHIGAGFALYKLINRELKDEEGGEDE